MDIPFVVVPLYMYPLPGAWDPLFANALAHPDILFLAIVNPNNGPGRGALPDAMYRAALRELDAVSNIRPLGYVHCSYGRRGLDAVTADIDRYRAWNTNAKQSMRLEGIFFDEAPSEASKLKYMETATQYARDTWRCNLERQAHVVQNPGVVVPHDYFAQADHVVVFEQAESHWARQSIKQDLSQISTDDRRKAVAIVHSCGKARDSLTKLVREMKHLGFGGLYLTEQMGGGYSGWPEHLGHVVAVVAESQELSQ